MRHLVLAGLMICAVCAVGVAAENAPAKTSEQTSQTVVFEEAGGSGERAIDTGDPRQKGPNDGGVNDAGTMPSYESYDPNTGLPNDVASDSSGEFD